MNLIDLINSEPLKSIQKVLIIFTSRCNKY